MDVGKSFTYMFEDKDWIAKIAIGGIVTLLSIFIIPIPLLIGYSLEVIKRVYNGDPSPLPEWNNIGDMFVKGLYACVGGLIWLSPALVLMCCTILAFIPLSGGNGSDSMSGLASALVSCLACLIAIISFAINIFIYAPGTMFAVNDKVNTFWDFRSIWAFIKANPGNYIIALLLAIVANFIGGLGAIFCLIGAFFTGFWATLVIAHLFGQVARSNLNPTDSNILPPGPPPSDEPPNYLPGSYEPAPSA